MNTKDTIAIEPSWRQALAAEFEREYFSSLRAAVRAEYIKRAVYPPPRLIFNAFALCPFPTVKVVILGQDPYHGHGQAHGLSFSVPDGMSLPPSLQNIYKEIVADTGAEPPKSGNLERWAKQGVLLLNATLTVRRGEPASHRGIGWETFTDAVISKISTEKNHVVFMLWGKYAQDKRALIDEKKHCVLIAAHPSPLSARNGWFGCRHFSRANAYLKAHGQKPIAW
jgi:uracil-DNA glycosylase